MNREPVCCVYGRPVAQEDSLNAMRNLQHHIVHVLGAEPVDRWTVEVTYKLKKKKKKAMASEMKFGVNVAAPFVGMKRDDCIDYPYAKQFCIRRSDRGSRVLIVQEMDEESQAAFDARRSSTPERRDHSMVEGQLSHVLDGEDELESILAAKAALVTRLKAVINGQIYRLGDFHIRVGSCRKGAVFRGLALEVEYMPCCRISDGLAMIGSFLPSIDELATFVPTSDLRDQAVFGSDAFFSVKHTGLQTVDLFNKVFS